MVATMSLDHRLDPALLTDPAHAERVAELMQALSAPSRLRILAAIAHDARTVGEIAAAVAMEPSAVSHQLRILRHLRLVVATREGRHVRYRPHDHHVGPLLVQAMSHVDHAAHAAAPVEDAA